ncbi:MAG: hypothetical protein QOG25_3670, partial [Acetobacteraceae bacterium]|nr:hypothetical protein [Acetobacteraceae bacterium]
MVGRRNDGFVAGSRSAAAGSERGLAGTRAPAERISDFGGPISEQLSWRDLNRERERDVLR